MGLKAILNNARFAQVGFVVNDIEATREQFALLFDCEVPPADICGEYEVMQTQVFGQPAPKANCRLAFFDLTPGVQLELIEPNEEPSVWRDSLNEFGEGIHHIAFQIETGGNALPAKLAVGVKTVKGSGGGITVNETPYDVTCATEMYKDILEAVSWANTTSGSYQTNVVVIRNTSSSSVISLTNLKWSYGANESKANAPARMLRFSFSRSAMNTLELAESTGETGAQTLDSSAVTVTWDKDTFELGETATLTITAPANFEKALLDGKEIAGYEELDNGMRQWTYQVTAEELGAVSADVTLEDANGYRTKALSAPALAAQEPTVDLTEVTAVWENDTITLGETALLTVTVPANIVSVTVGGEELTQFTLNEDGTKSFQYTVTPDAADAYQYTVTLAEGHGYTFDAGATPLLTVNEPETPEHPETPEVPGTTDTPTDDPAGNGTSKTGGRWSIYDLIRAIIDFCRKVIGMFKIEA